MLAAKLRELGISPEHITEFGNPDNSQQIEIFLLNAGFRLKISRFRE
jgi:hypothetical protein